MYHTRLYRYYRQQPQPVNNMQALFQMIDPGGNGVVTAEKLRQVSEEWGLGFTEDEIQGMIKEADPSGRGFVNFKEIDNLMESSKVAMEAEEQLLESIEEAFEYFDPGQLGRIKSIDLGSALRMANVNPTPQDVRDLLKKLKYPRTITYNQFKRVTKEAGRKDHQRLVAALQCFDPNNTGYLTPDKLRAILKPTAGKTFTSFTKQDMEDIIERFTRNGRIDTEVFVHYLMGHEKYLPKERQLPPTPEQTSLTRLRKHSGSDFGREDRTEKTDIQPRLNAAFKRKLKFYQQMKYREELQRQREAKKKRKYTRTRRIRLHEIPENKTLTPRNESNEGDIDNNEKENIEDKDDIEDIGDIDNNEKENIEDKDDTGDIGDIEINARVPSSSDAQDVDDTTQKQGDVQQNEDELDFVSKRRKLDLNQTDQKKPTIHTDRTTKVKNQTAKYKSRKKENVKDSNLKDTDREKRTSDIEKKTGQTKVVQSRKLKKNEMTKKIDIAGSQKGVSKDDGNEESGETDIETKEQKQLDTKDKNKEQKDKYPAKDEKLSEKQGKETKTVDDKAKASKEKQKFENSLLYGIHVNKDLGYADRHTIDKLREKQKAEETTKPQHHSEIQRKNQSHEDDKNAEDKKATYVEIRGIKKKYKEDNKVEVKNEFAPPKKMSSDKDKQSENAEPMVKGYADMHELGKQQKKQNKSEQLKDSVDNTNRSADENSTELVNKDKVSVKGYADLHRNDGKRNNKNELDDSLLSDSKESVKSSTNNKKEITKKEKEPPTYAKLRESYKEFKANQPIAEEHRHAIIRHILFNGPQVELHAKKERNYIELHRPDERANQIRPKMDAEENRLDESYQKMSESSGNGEDIVKDEPKTYAKLNETTRKMRFEKALDKSLREMNEAVKPVERNIEPIEEIKPKGYADLHPASDRLLKLHPRQDDQIEDEKYNDDFENKKEDITVTRHDEPVNSKSYAKLNETSRKKRFEKALDKSLREMNQAVKPAEKIVEPLEEIKPKGYADLHPASDRLLKLHPRQDDQIEDEKYNNEFDHKKKDITDTRHGEPVSSKSYAKLNEIGKKFRTERERTIIDSQTSSNVNLSKPKAPVEIAAPQPKGYADLHQANEITKSTGVLQEIQPPVALLLDHNIPPLANEKEEEKKTYAKLNEKQRVYKEELQKDILFNAYDNKHSREDINPSNPNISHEKEVKRYTELHKQHTKPNQYVDYIHSTDKNDGNKSELKPSTDTHVDGTEDSRNEKGTRSYLKLAELSKKIYKPQTPDVFSSRQEKHAEKFDNQKVLTETKQTGYVNTYHSDEQIKEFDLLEYLELAANAKSPANVDMPSSKHTNKFKNDTDKGTNVNRNVEARKYYETKKELYVQKPTLEEPVVKQEKVEQHEPKTKRYTDIHQTDGRKQLLLAPDPLGPKHDKNVGYNMDEDKTPRQHEEEKVTYFKLNDTSRKYHEHHKQDQQKAISAPAEKQHKKEPQPQPQPTAPKGYVNRLRESEKQKENNARFYHSNNVTSHDKENANIRPKDSPRIPTDTNKQSYARLGETTRKQLAYDQAESHQPRVPLLVQPIENNTQSQTPVVKSKSYTDRHREGVQFKGVNQYMHHSQAKQNESLQPNITKSLVREKSSNSAPGLLKTGYSNKLLPKVKTSSNTNTNGMKTRRSSGNSVQSQPERNKTYAKQYRSVVQTNTNPNTSATKNYASAVSHKENVMKTSLSKKGKVLPPVSV